MRLVVTLRRGWISPRVILIIAAPVIALWTLIATPFARIEIEPEHPTLPESTAGTYSI